MASAALVQCTFHGNEATWGSNVSCDCGSTIEMSNCIVTGGIAAEVFYVDESSSATLICTDIHGNEGGDWVGPLADQLGQDGNISADPLYCNALARDFTLAESSPCAPKVDPECGLIGAHPVSCAVPTGAPLASVPAAQVILEPNYPNPFNPATTLRFVLPEAYERDSASTRSTDGWSAVSWMRLLAPAATRSRGTASIATAGRSPRGSTWASSRLAVRGTASVSCS